MSEIGQTINTVAQFGCSFVTDEDTVLPIGLLHTIDTLFPTKRDSSASEFATKTKFDDLMGMLQTAINLKSGLKSIAVVSDAVFNTGISTLNGWEGVKHAGKLAAFAKSLDFTKRYNQTVARSSMGVEWGELTPGRLTLVSGACTIACSLQKDGLTIKSFTTVYFRVMVMVKPFFTELSYWGLISGANCDKAVKKIDEILYNRPLKLIVGIASTGHALLNHQDGVLATKITEMWNAVPTPGAAQAA